MKKTKEKRKKKDYYAKDHPTSLPSPFIANNTVFSECARAYSPDNVISMRSTGRAVQY